MSHQIRFDAQKSVLVLGSAYFGRRNCIQDDESQESASVSQVGLIFLQKLYHKYYKQLATHLYDQYTSKRLKLLPSSPTTPATQTLWVKERRRFFINRSISSALEPETNSLRAHGSHHLGFFERTDFMAGQPTNP